MQFPREPLATRDLRRDALERFRWRCRLPVLRNYGPEAGDLAIFVTACDDCGARTAKLSTLDDLDPDTAIDGLISELRTRAVRPRYGWRPTHCPACEAPRPDPISAVYARYMPEVEHDLHIELVFGRHRVLAVELHRVALDGTSASLPRPDGPLRFQEAFGAPLVLRALWRAFITQHIYDESMVVRAIEPGYVIGLRPFTDDPAEAEAMLAPFGPFIEQLREGVEGYAGWDAITFLYEREHDDIPVPYAESYHAWLGGYAAEIREGLIEPFVVADSDAFIDRLGEHAALYGLRVERDSGEGALFVRFFAGHLDLRLNVGPLFFQILHQGLTFERGITALFLRELRAMGEAKRVPHAVQQLLPEHAVRVVQGQYLELCDPAGERVAFADMVRLATHYDLDDPAGRAELVAELLALDPEAAHAQA